MELGIHHSVFDRDSEVMCNVLKSADFDHSSIGQFVNDVLSIMSSCRTFSFSHTTGNCIAHAFSKESKSFFSFVSLNEACSTWHFSVCCF